MIDLLDPGAIGSAPGQDGLPLGFHPGFDPLDLAVQAVDLALDISLPLFDFPLFGESASRYQIKEMGLQQTARI